MKLEETTASSQSVPRLATAQEWRQARLALLEKEKQFTREKDALALARRQLPWLPVEKDYRFDSESGPLSLGDAFAGRSQLIVYHLMFGPDWEQACKSCSFVADHFDGALPHLQARDVTLIAVSRGPLDRLLAFRDRMGWKFPWYSSLGSSFNFDFRVSFELNGAPSKTFEYNYVETPIESEEAPGYSVFAKDSAGRVHHTYSTYSRGVETAMATYHLLDLTPRGRDEVGLEYTMQWVRHHDRYET